MFGLADAMAITDQGTLYIDDSVNGGVVGFTPDGDYFLSQAAPGFSGATVIEGSALDGRVMVGWGTGSPEGYTYGPVKIVDGEYQPLPLPELNYRGDEHDQGAMARGISANGEIIYGSTWDNEDAGMIWWDAEGTARYVGEDVRNEREVTMVDWSGSEYTYTLVDGVQTWSGAGQASPDGKWLAGTFTVESLNETRDRINSTYYPAYFNTETGQTTVLEDYEGYGGCGVTDEGFAFMAAVGGMGGSGPVVNLENGATVAYASLEEYVQERFGINVPSGGQFKYMAADGSVLLASTVIAAPWGPISRRGTSRREDRKVNEATAHYIRCINYSSASVPSGVPTFFVVAPCAPPRAWERYPLPAGGRILPAAHAGGSSLRSSRHGEVAGGNRLQVSPEALAGRFGCCKPLSDVSYLTFAGERMLFLYRESPCEVPKFVSCCFF